MKDPYRMLWFWSNINSFPKGIWRYSVKWTGDAFYIGSDDEHITITEGANGFHHSFNERGKHITRKQHESCNSLLSIIGHINANNSAYPNPERDKILAALMYLETNKTAM